MQKKTPQLLSKPNPQSHPLKKRITANNLTLWQLSSLLGGKPGESYLSRSLNGIILLPAELENRIEAILDRLRGGC